jgi:sucrose-6-phosphate hydrolase SacC (GH32 family)
MRTIQILLIVKLSVLCQGYKQKPIYHLTPEDGHWINDPNGMFYDLTFEKYHVFAQYNPNAPYWGDMSWIHWVSDDLVKWEKLPVAITNDESYDKGGAFSGSAILIGGEDGEVMTPALVYTCVETNNVENQCLATAADSKDPNHVSWSKSKSNPVISYSSLPDGNNPTNFRDPTLWRQTCGNTSWSLAAAAEISGVGHIVLYNCEIAVKPEEIFNCTYQSSLWRADSVNAAYNTYMVECPDFYKIGHHPYDSGRLYVLKYSVMEERREIYELGNFDEANGQFRRDMDHFSNRLEYDYGPNDHFYASKRFYDPITQKQLLYGWSNEHDDHYTERNWAGVLSLPRTVRLNEDLNILAFQPDARVQQLRQTPMKPTHSFGGADGKLIHFDMKQDYLNIINEYPVRHPKQFIQIFPTEISSLATEVKVMFNVTYQIQGGEEEGCGNVIEIGLLGRQSYDGKHYIKHGVGIRRDIPSSDQNSSSLLYSIIDTRQASGTTPLTLYTRDFPGYTQENAKYFLQQLNEKQNQIMIEMHVFYDHSIIEAYLRGGDVASTVRVYPEENDSMLSLFAATTCMNDKIVVEGLDAWDMKSLWK